MSMYNLCMHKNSTYVKNWIFEFVLNQNTAEILKDLLHFPRFFDDLVNNIDCDAETVAMVKRVGQHHAILNTSCGFHADIWEQLGEITMEKVCATDAVQVDSIYIQRNHSPNTFNTHSMKQTSNIHSTHIQTKTFNTYSNKKHSTHIL